MLVCAVGCYQLSCLYRLFQGEDEGGIFSRSQLDDHIGYESGPHAPGAQFCSTQDAVSFKDYPGGYAGGLAELVINGPHAAAGFQDDEGFVLEGLEGNGRIGQGLHPIVLACQGMVLRHCHKYAFLHEGNGRGV